MSSTARILNILLIGQITMLFAEVLSGSSILWFISLPGVAITYTFYILHTLLFFNIAYRFRKLDFPGLYFIGVLYGCYEFWVTTVPVYGYLNKTPILGSFLGVSIFEYFVLIFFWHPIMSFIIAIVSFNYFSLFSSSNEPVSAAPISIEFLENSVKNKIFWSLIILLGSLVLILYSQLNILVFILGYFGTLGLIALTVYVIMKLGYEIDHSYLVLGNRALYFVAFLVLSFYVGFFYLKTGFSIKNLFPVVALITYMLGILGVKLSKDTQLASIIEYHENGFIKLKYYFLLPAIVVITTILLPNIIGVLALLSFLSLLPISIISLAYAMIRLKKGR